MALFDLGGVVIECTPFSKMLEWQTHVRTSDEILTKWSESSAVRDYQLGVISTKDFAESIIEEFELKVGVVRFMREYRLIPKDFYSGAEILLSQISKNTVTACLSNTNELHWKKLCSINNLEKNFKYCFPSHLIHSIKPDEDAFAHVLKVLNLPADQIAFFDDRAENVETAKKMGFIAFKTEGMKELCTAIQVLNIL